MLRDALATVLAGGELSREQARGVFGAAIQKDTDPVQLGGLLCALAQRGEAASEIAGAADALRQAMRPFVHDCPDAVDTAGTGGDGKGSFNLSTAAAVVAAAAGAKVIKHGNRKISSRCGSADLLAALGVPLSLEPSASRAVLEEVGITFLLAPDYHPALAVAAPVRAALGVRTVFNLLGPLLNPGRVKRQIVGVSDRARAPLLATVLTELGAERAYVVHGHAGADELTLGGTNHVHVVGAAPDASFDARALGLGQAPDEALAGGDAATNLRLLHEVFGNSPGPLTDAVVLNAAAALLVAGVTDVEQEAVDRAKEAIASGAAAAKLAAWVEVSGRRAAESVS